MKSEISSTTVGLEICIENSPQRCFSRVFRSRDAILSAISHPKLKLKWVEGQLRKDQYKRMFIDEMGKYDNEMVIVEDRNPEPDAANQKRISTNFNLMKRNPPETLLKEKLLNI